MSVTSITITSEEIAALAKSSYILLKEEYVSVLTKQIHQVVFYAHSVCSFDRSTEHALPHNINIIRQDVASPCAMLGILDRAPQREGTYFVVPIIIGK